MKIKNKILALVCLILFVGFSSCTKTEYVDAGPIENPNRSYIVVLRANNWVRVSPALIRYNIPLSALNDYYMDQGGVAVALSFDNEASYDVLPATFDGLAYSINYGVGEISILVDDPLGTDDIDVTIPGGDIVAKIILSTTDYYEYSGFFNSPSSIFDFKALNIDSSK